MWKLLILMWKNWLLTWRQPKNVVFFVLSMLLCPAVITIIRFAPSSMKAVSYTPFCIHQLVHTSCTSDSKLLRDLILVYSPKNEVLERVVSIFSKSFREIVPLKNSTRLEAFVANRSDVFAGIQFNDNYHSLQNISSKTQLKVSIRFPGELRYPLTMTEDDWKTNARFDLTRPLAGPREYDANTGGDPNYFEEGFLEMQYYLTLSVLLERYGIQGKDEATVTGWIKANKFPAITMKRFPHSAWLEDRSLNIIAGALPYIIWLSFLYAYGQMVEELVLEKELQLKEMMKIMGLPSITHWLSWFIKYFVQLTVGSLLLSVLLTRRIYSDPFFYHSNMWVVFCLLIVFSCSLIAFAFLISTLFSKATTANFWSQIIIMLTFAPYLFMSNFLKSYQDKFGASFVMSTGFGFGINVILAHERLGEGLQWSNIFQSLRGEVALAWILIVLAIDSVLYLLAAFYIDALFPGKFGVPKPWHFFFTCFFPKKKTVEDIELQYGSRKSRQKLPGIERTSVDLPVGIEIRKLNMEFGKQSVVKNLTMDIYQNEITVLLGHNGAGKTTTLSILLGLFSPTGGTAIINDYDIRKEIGSVRKSLGYCPQGNILYKNLTVRDHFILFGMLKGLTWLQADEEADNYIEILNLFDMDNVPASKLSGGTKRKLCIGIALCGPSKFILLDEPTAGIDPLSKRVIWETLRHLKKDRTILITTHSMEEADLFGDRIAIMVKGELRCYGTNYFLKKEFGAGYRLIISKDYKCYVPYVTRLLRQFLPSIEVYSEIGSELTYILEDSSRTPLGPMLDKLEKESKFIGIVNFGISLTSLEEIFMKVGAEEEAETVVKDRPEAAEKLNLSPNFSSGCVLLWLQFQAMILKRSIFTGQWSFVTFLHLFMPLIHILFLTLSDDISRWALLLLPPVTLNLSPFETHASTVTLVENNDNSDYFKYYKSLFKDGVTTVHNISKEILTLTKHDPEKVHFRYVIGATFSDANSNNITAWFNNDGYHAVGITMSYVLNAIFKKINDCQHCSINFINYPFPLKAETQLKIIETGLTAGSNLVFCLFFAFLAISAFFTIFVIKERVSKFKHQQFISGVNLFIFWIATFLWDAMLYILAVMVTLISLALYKQDGFSTLEDLRRLFLIFMYFGYAVIPFAYCISYFFQYPSSGYSFMISIFMILGLVFFVVDKVVMQGYEAGLAHWLFLLLPQYSLLLGLSDSNQLYAIYNKVCYPQACKTLDLEYSKCIDIIQDDNTRKYCQGIHGGYFVMQPPGIGGNVVIALIEGTIFFAILLFMDSSWMNTLRNIIYLNPKKPIPLPNEDPDVAAEKYYIKNLFPGEIIEEYTVAASNLTKCYGKKRAVNGVYLGIKNSECFGLVGLNGAGKTTTFRMISADISITYGDAWVNKFDVKKNMKGAQKSAAYCAQSNGILEEMTPREAIITFCLLRGILFRRARTIATFLASEFNFDKHLDKTIKNLSGGNQRKLNSAVCLIGDPRVVFLDEPSAGLDPASKHYLWKALSAIREEGKCILLTTHDMEECEALCTRLAIMVNGSFRCLGSKQELKRKFSHGYILVIKMMRVPVMKSDTEDVEEFVYTNFPDATLREKIQDLVVFYITDPSLSWSKAFNIMDRGIESVEDIVDFTFSQGTLEQVFLTLTKNQDNPKR